MSPSEFFKRIFNTYPGGVEIVDGLALKFGKNTTLPQCNQKHRREMRFIQGSGVDDGLNVCIRDSTDTYAWQNVGTILDANLSALKTAFTRATSTGPASLAFHEDTDNGTNKITVIGVSSVSSDKTLTLPDVTGTIAVAPTITVRTTTGAAIANNAFQSITATCSAGEVCTGGGFAAVTSTLVRVSSAYPSSTTAWTVAWTNVSGANAQMTVYAVCSKFGA